MRPKLQALIAACAVVIMACGIATALPLPDARSLSKQIDKVGGNAVVTSLLQHGQWDGLLHEVDKGEPDWIAIAGRLMQTPLSCAECGETLPISLATALPRNPSAVLAAISSKHSLAQVCGCPFIEPTPIEVEAYVSRTRAALQRVGLAALSDKRDACLSTLNNVKETQ